MSSSDQVLPDGTHPELLKDRDVAAICNCSRRHVHQMAKRGELPKPLRFGGLIRWRRSELLAWIGAIGQEASHA